jgi:hypothetical protein
MSTVTGYDVTASNYALRPSSGQIALYVTGNDGIAASAAMLAANPKAIRIDQSPVITAIDTTADVYDLEAGAVTVAEIGQVIKDAWNNFNHAVRPGQRKPMVYMSASNLTPVANALVAAGTTSSLFVAHWGVSLADATAQVGAATGPFPLDGFQYQNAGNYDLDVWSTDWLNTVSSVTPIILPPLKLWHGIFVGTQDGTTTKQGSSFVVPLVSADGGKTFKPTAAGKGE